MRGKLILLSRNCSSDWTGWWLDWSGNPHPHEGHDRVDTWMCYSVQDHYSLNTVNINDKESQIKDQIDRAINNDHYPVTRRQDYYKIYINYISGEADASGRDPNYYAEHLNPKINDYIKGLKSNKRIGVIMMDFAGYHCDELIGSIINQNFKK
jgi:hypothetical protein